MKTIASITFALFILVFSGCSSSKSPSDTAAAVEDAMQSPVAGTWAVDGGSDAIHFMDSGDVMLEQGDILAAINRFQNTERARYISRLQKEASYEWNDASELILHVTADWTGKGTGARRPEDKQVDSRIVFDIESMDENTVTLRKKSMTQNGEEKHADEELAFKLMRK